MDDSNIIVNIIENDKEALDNLVDSYGKLIYGVIASVMLPNNMESDIDECFNDVLITIWTKIKSFDNKKGKFRNWIISLSKYKALDYLRRKRGFESINESYCNDENSLEDKIISDEEKEILKKAIISLNEVDREIFTLRFLEDLDIDTVSKQLNIEKGAIYTRISRGKKKLKKIMEGYYEE